MLFEFSWPEIGRRYRIARLTLGLTEKEAADAYGVTLRTYRKWEAGGRQTNRSDYVVRFAEKYDVSLDWLMVGDGSNVRRHLAQHAKGKIAILPSATRWPQGGTAS
jgi:transcriptional regulator with XRE-family HTH domain